MNPTTNKPHTLKKHRFYPGDIPAKPGVYIFRDIFAVVIYVGKARNLRKRMSQYFQASRIDRADPKLRSLINSIDTWEFITVKNEDESLILESRLIKEYAPKYNVLLRDDKRHLLLKIDLSEPFPRLKTVRLKKSDSCLYFGPFPSCGNLHLVAEFLVRYLGLRTCKKSTAPDESDHAHCLAGTVRDCCRPCIGKTTPEQYHERLEKLLDILNGNTTEVTEYLKGKMRISAEKKNFEKAAKLRDIAEGIESLCGIKRRRFIHAKTPESIRGEEGITDLQKALKLKILPVNIECIDISNISGTLAVAGLVHFTDGKSDKAKYRRFRIKTVEGINDFAMMAEAVKRHFSRLMETRQPLPDLLMVDGGKGQLDAALNALVSENVPPFPVIGLAKKLEEVYIPGCRLPIVMERERAALKLLQSIRDEAHRFAVSYHKTLRIKTIHDSILDDIEGIGEKRKQAVLKEFGSVRAIRRAKPEDIERRVSGIGEKFARMIYEYLQSHLPDGGMDPL